MMGARTVSTEGRTLDLGDKSLVTTLTTRTRSVLTLTYSIRTHCLPGLTGNKEVLTALRGGQGQYLL